MKEVVFKYKIHKNQSSIKRFYIKKNKQDKSCGNKKLEDLAVLKRSPDLLNNVKIVQDQLRLIMKHIFFMGVATILVK